MASMADELEIRNDDDQTNSRSLRDVIKGKKERKRKRQEKLLEKLSRKKKREEEEEAQQDSGQSLKEQRYTVSLALPGSILDNAQSVELRTYLAGQIARALAVFAIDEVIIFDDQPEQKSVAGIAKDKEEANSIEGEFKGSGKNTKGSVLLARILQYLECPQYLRKHFFPIHADLKYAGVLNPTDMPHHLRAQEKSLFREAVVLDRPPTKRGSLVDAGLHKTTVIDRTLEAGLRVTIRLNPAEDKPSSKIYGQVVSPNSPRTEAGLYWGYQVRLAKRLSTVFSECPYKGGYDTTIGTSERGSSIDECTISENFKHLLIVFGGVKGLELALDADEDLEGEDPAPLFDYYLNTCPLQGSRTIRTEEAILISLAGLRPKISAIGTG